MTAFCCSECIKYDTRKVFDNMDTMELHLAKEHFRISLFECPSCPNAQFATECALVDHTKHKHNRTRVEIAYVLDRSAHRARRELLRCLIKCAQQAPNVKHEQSEVPVEPVQANIDFSDNEAELICLSDSETDDEVPVIEEQQSRQKRVKSEPAAPTRLSEVAEALTLESRASEATVSLTERNMKVEGLENYQNKYPAPELEDSRQETQDQTSSFNLRKSFEALMADSTVESSELVQPAEVSSSEDNASASAFMSICPKKQLRSEHSIASTNSAAQNTIQSTFAEPHSPDLGLLQSAQPESTRAGRKRAHDTQPGLNHRSKENTTSARHSQKRPASPTFSVVTNRSRRRLFSSSSTATRAGPKKPKSAYMIFRKEMKDKISAVARQTGHPFSERPWASIRSLGSK